MTFSLEYLAATPGSNQIIRIPVRIWGWMHWWWHTYSASENKADYVNRRSIHSINVQVHWHAPVCNGQRLYHNTVTSLILCTVKSN